MAGSLLPYSPHQLYPSPLRTHTNLKKSQRCVFRTCRLPQVIAAGCCLWGVMTAALAACTSLAAAMACAAVNGLGLALVVPVSASIVADLHPAAARGSAFGAMNTVSALGGALGGMFATNMGGKRFGPLDGWRAACLTVAAVSVAVGGLIAAFGSDPRERRSSAQRVSPRDQDGALGGSDGSDALPRHLKRHSDCGSTGGPAHAFSAALRLEAANYAAAVRHIFRLPTFRVIVVQGLAGNVPWTAMAYFTLWLQLSGFSDAAASGLVAALAAGTAAGALLGGFLADRAAARLPDAGRILVAQTSVALGLPLTYVLLQVLPYSASAAAQSTSAYFWVLLFLGLTCSWCGGGCNSPIFAEIVPPHMRTSVYAFDRCLEMSLAAMCSPIIGLLAERAYGFEGHVGGGTSSDDDSGAEPARQAHNAQALGYSLRDCMIWPWCFCFVAYCALYRTYPRDRQRALRLSSQHH